MIFGLFSQRSGLSSNAASMGLSLVSKVLLLIKSLEDVVMETEKKENGFIKKQ
jgi:hypothetical protein